MAIWQENRSVMPAGVGSLFRLADPFPMVVKRAKGARMWDADDNEYLDFMLGFSTMILGNSPDEVEATLRESLPRGTSYGQCHEGEHAFAKLFCDMIPGVEKVAFCNSGTEATMYALQWFSFELYNFALVVPFIMLAIIFERMRRKAREPKDDPGSSELVYWQRQEKGNRS